MTVELLLPGTMLVPGELFDAERGAEMLAANGMPPTAEESVVASDPEAEFVAVTAINREALRQVDIPHYRALILRKTFPQLSDLVDKSQLYYRRAFPEAQYNATSHVWVFPSGAKIYFGSMQHTKDRTNYQGKAFDFIGFDELTHFEWEEYSYMMSRNRPTGPGTRVYLRATTNPGGVGHGWVKARFITPAPPGTPIVEQFPVRMPDGAEKVLQAQGDYDVFLLSATPDLYFTSLTYAQGAPGQPTEYPLMNAGKAVMREGRLVMPLSIFVNHAFVDGAHISRFFKLVEECLKRISA